MGRAAELGGSLLASKQRRDDKFNEEREKWEKRQALFELVVPAVQTAMVESAKRKDAELLTSDPDVMEVASNFQIAAKNSAELLATEEAIAKSGLSSNEYMYNLHKDNFRARAISELESRPGNEYRAIGDAGPFNSIIEDQTRLLTDALTTDYETALSSVRNIGTEEQRAALLTELTTSVNPRRITGRLIKSARGFFGGKSKEELDAAAIDALSNSSIAENVETFNEFKKAYDESKDIHDAFDMAKLEAPVYDETGMYEISTEIIKYIGTNDRLVTQEIKTKTHRNTGEKIQERGDIENVFYGKEDTADEIDKKALGIMMDDVNIFELMVDIATPEAREVFVTRAKAVNPPLRFMNPRTVAEYEEVQKLAETILNEDPSANLKNEIENATALALMSQLGNTALEITMMMAQFEDDPAEREKHMIKIEEILADNFNFADYFNSLGDTNTGQQD